MSDNFSITDNIILQNAAIDASLRRISMQNAAQRNTQGSGATLSTAVGNAPAPVSRNGFVMGRVVLQHKPSRTNCSIRDGREVSTLNFTNQRGYDNFRA